MKKRITSILLCLCLMAALLPALSAPAQASTNGHSQADAVAWTKKQIGKYLDYDGYPSSNPYQCWDLAKYYYVYLGNGKYCTGNATTFVSNQLPPGWTRDKNPRPGDLCVWKGGTQGPPGWTVHPYGHIGIVIAVNGNKLTTVEQNINGSACKQTTRTASYVSCFIHPDFTPVNYLTIQYNANGGLVNSTKYKANSSGLITSDTSASTSRWANGQGDTTYGLANATTFGLSREGYSFAGWCLNKDGSGTVYDQNDLTLTSNQIYPGVKTASATVVMYAVWEPYTGGSHTHSGNYKLGYCEICGAWLPNQDESVSVKCGQYEFKKDSADNILVDYPYSLARTYGTLYKTFSGGDVVEVIGAVNNGIGNLWYRLRDDDGNVGYASSAMLTPLPETASHTHSLVKVPAEDADCFSSGHFAYWICSGCDRVFSDAQGNNETTREEQTIFILEHVYVEGVCARCGLIDPDYVGEVDPTVQDTEAAPEEGDPSTQPADPTEPEQPGQPAEPDQPVDPVVEPDPIPGAKNPFRDVASGAYYYDAVLWAYYAEPQITNGVTNDLFGPDQTVTRGQAVTFLWRSMGCPKPASKANPFVDVKGGDYYYDAVLWATRAGVTLGTSDTTFSPNATLSTRHIVTFLYRTLNPGQDGWNGEAASWAKNNDPQGRGMPFGVNVGISDNTPCPRADVVTFLFKALE